MFWEIIWEIICVLFQHMGLTAVLNKFLGAESKADLSFSLSHQLFEQ